MKENLASQPWFISVKYCLLGHNSFTSDLKLPLYFKNNNFLNIRKRKRTTSIYLVVIIRHEHFEKLTLTDKKF